MTGHVNLNLLPVRYEHQADVIRTIRAMSDEKLEALYLEGCAAVKTRGDDRDRFLLDLVSREIDIRNDTPPEEP